MSKKDDNQYVHFPEVYKRRVLNSLYREIPLKDTTFRTLRKYFNAMAHLYGVITLEEAYAIISDQSPKLVTRAEFRAFAEIAQHECEGYTILGSEEIFRDVKRASFWEKEIIDLFLIDEDLAAYFHTKTMQEGKPFYVPPKNAFLLYSDANYFEPTSTTAALRLFFEKHFKKDVMNAEQVLALFMFLLRYEDISMRQVMGDLEALGLVFKNENDINTFLNLYQTIHNNARLQANRGYTPMELRRMYAPDVQLPEAFSFETAAGSGVSEIVTDVDDVRNVLSTACYFNEAMNHAAPLMSDQGTSAAQRKKIGRNDPCPCGSGKKYKHCCGR